MKVFGEKEGLPLPLVIVEDGEVFNSDFFLEHKAEIPLPCYLLAEGSTYILKSNGLWTVNSKTKGVGWAGKAESFLFLNLPKKVPQVILARVYKFFLQIYEKHHSEGLAFIYWNPTTKEYIPYIPIQDVSGGGVQYQPGQNLPGCLRIVTLHSHPGFGNFRSGVDTADEEKIDKEGIHTILAFSPSGNVVPKTVTVLCVGKSTWNLDLDNVFDIKMDQIDSKLFKKGRWEKEPEIPASFLDLTDACIIPDDWFQAVSKKVTSLVKTPAEEEEKKLVVLKDLVQQESVLEVKRDTTVANSPLTYEVLTGISDPWWKNINALNDKDREEIGVYLTKEQMSSSLLVPSKRLGDGEVILPVDLAPVREALAAFLASKEAPVELIKAVKNADAAISSTNTYANGQNAKKLYLGLFMPIDTEIAAKYLPEKIYYFGDNNNYLASYHVQVLSNSLFFSQEEINILLTGMQVHFPEFMQALALADKDFACISSFCSGAVDVFPSLEFVVKDLESIYKELKVKKTAWFISSRWDQNWDSEYYGHNNYASYKTETKIPAWVKLPGQGKVRVTIRALDPPVSKKKKEKIEAKSSSDAKENSMDYFSCFTCKRYHVAGTSEIRVCKVCQVALVPTKLIDGKFIPIVEVKAKDTRINTDTESTKMCYLGSISGKTLAMDYVRLYGFSPSGCPPALLYAKFDKIDKIVWKATLKSMGEDKDQKYTRAMCAADAVVEHLEEVFPGDSFKKYIRGVMETLVNGKFWRVEIELAVEPEAVEWKEAVDKLCKEIPAQVFSVPILIFPPSRMIATVE
jgi:hypothetical protein